MQVWILRIYDKSRLTIDKFYTDSEKENDANKNVK